MNGQEAVQGIDAFQYANPGYDHWTQERQTPEYEQRRFRLVDSVLSYALQAGELDWILGNSESPRTDQYDVTGVEADFIPSAPPLPEHDRSSIDSITQELRLVGHSPQLSYTGSAFYRRARNRLDQEVRASGLGEAEYELQVALDNVTNAQPVTQALRYLGALQQYTVRPRSLQIKHSPSVVNILKQQNRESRNDKHD